MIIRGEYHCQYRREEDTSAFTSFYLQHTSLSKIVASEERGRGNDPSKGQGPGWVVRRLFKSHSLKRNGMRCVCSLLGQSHRPSFYTTQRMPFLGSLEQGWRWCVTYLDSGQPQTRRHWAECPLQPRHALGVQPICAAAAYALQSARY